MSEEESITQQLKSLLREAYQAFREFMTGLSSIREERKKIIASAHQEEDQKKMAIIKSRINQL